MNSGSDIIEDKSIPTVDFVAWLRNEDMKVEIRERDTSLTNAGLAKFFTRIPNLEIGEPYGFLSSIHGDGKTKTDAIKALIQQMDGRRLVRDAYTDKRKEYLLHFSLGHLNELGI